MTTYIKTELVLFWHVGYKTVIEQGDGVSE